MVKKVLKEKVCKLKTCRKNFKPTKNWQKYCCTKHRKEDWDSKHMTVSSKEYAAFKKSQKGAM